MKKNIFLLFVTISVGLKAQITDSIQTNDSKDTITHIYDYIEIMPEFPGGTAELFDFISKNIKYPKTAKKNKIEGIVYAKFIVDEQGNVIDPVIVRGIGGGCDEEVIRVIKLMPKWKPGKQSGENAAVYYVLPCRFTLSD